MLTELRKKLDRKEISVAELCNEYSARINKSETNSCITICDISDEIKKAQADINDGKSLPLTGIPIAVKDNICTKGIKTTCASKMLADFVPVYDACAVASLKKNGGIIHIKTNMDEFAMGSRGDASYFGAVRNPYDKEYSAGGSSAGSAAAVAEKLCPAALGSDTGGSVRLPAAFCGVTGLNPTYGSVSRYGLIAFASSLDRIGIIANSAADTGLLFNTVAGADLNDFTSFNTSDNVADNTGKLKIGISDEFFCGADSETVKACTEAIEFYRRSGFEIVNVSFKPLKYAVSAYYIISSAEAASNMARFDGVKFGFCTEEKTDFTEMIAKTRGEAFGDEVKRRILIGNYVLSAERRNMYYQKALNTKQAIRLEFDEIFKKCDIFLSPSSPHSAEKLCEKKSSADIYKDDIYTVPSSLAGLPSVTTCCGYCKNNMPIGMSLTGRAFDEKTIISAADLFEKNFTRREASV